MKDEIKEILDRLERMDHKEYSCGFEFADSSTFDETSRCFEERKKMANYITNLQEQLEIKNEGFKATVEELCDTTKKYEEYKSRCEKAIEKLESIRTFGLRSGKTLFSTLINESIDILNGGDEE